MKKLFVVIALAILSISANAQLYLGGALSFQAAGNNATVTILPELGYNINKTSAIGAQIGWSNATAANRFVIAPYYRYGVKAFGPVSFFIDGEFQLDSAIRPEIAAKKVRRESAVAGRANVIICPDINVGNIGVKLVQNFAHADAYGPMLQGFKKIVCDCSRSAPVSELVGNVVMSCVRAQALKA